ncbi:MAG: hypothetical protein EHM70_22845, partial [Chloroflexota bacterium]
ELMTKPEERLEAPPAWVQDIAEEAPAAGEVEPVVEAQETIGQEIPVALPGVEAPVEAAADLLGDTQPIKLIPTVAPVVEAEEITQVMQPVVIEPALSEPAPSEPALVEAAPDEPVSAEPELPDWLAETAAKEPVEEEYSWVPPAVEMEKTVVAPPVTPTKGTGRLGKTPEKQVNINTASLVELESLPGIGFILAQNIIGFRETFGPFKQLDDLTKVPGINRAVLDDIGKWLTTGEEPAAPEKPLAVEIPSEYTGAAQGDRLKAYNDLSGGKITEAIDVYTTLIKNEVCLSDIIYDLKEAVRRNASEVGLWQTLGDAYVRNNQFQDALDAYVKAEELLR